MSEVIERENQVDKDDTTVPDMNNDIGDGKGGNEGVLKMIKDDHEFLLSETMPETFNEANDVFKGCSKGMMALQTCHMSNKYAVDTTYGVAYWQVEAEDICRRTAAVSAALSMTINPDYFPLSYVHDCNISQCKQSIFNFGIHPTKCFDYMDVWIELLELYKGISGFFKAYEAHRNSLTPKKKMKRKADGAMEEVETVNGLDETTKKKDTILVKRGCEWYQAVLLAAFELMTRVCNSTVEVYPSIPPGFVKGDYVSIFGFALLTYLFNKNRKPRKQKTVGNHMMNTENVKSTDDLFKRHVERGRQRSGGTWDIYNVDLENTNDVNNENYTSEMTSVGNSAGGKSGGYKQRLSFEKEDVLLMPTRGKKLMLFTDTGAISAALGDAVKVATKKLIKYQVLSSSTFNAILIVSITNSAVYNFSLSRSGFTFKPSAKYPLYSRIPTRILTTYAPLFDLNVILYHKREMFNQKWKTFYDLSRGMTYFVDRDFHPNIKELVYHVEKSVQYKSRINALLQTYRYDSENIMDEIRSLIDGIFKLKCDTKNRFLKYKSRGERLYCCDTWLFYTPIKYKPTLHFDAAKITEYNKKKTAAGKTNELIATSIKGPMKAMLDMLLKRKYVNSRAEIKAVKFNGEAKGCNIKHWLTNNDYFIFHTINHYRRIYSAYDDSNNNSMQCQCESSHDRTLDGDVIGFEDYDEKDKNFTVEEINKKPENFIYSNNNLKNAEDHVDKYLGSLEGKYDKVFKASGAFYDHEGTGTFNVGLVSSTDRTYDHANYLKLNEKQRKRRDYEESKTTSVGGNRDDYGDANRHANFSSVSERRMQQQNRMNKLKGYGGGDSSFSEMNTSHVSGSFGEDDRDW